jgi:hypothetical protein
MGPPGSWGLPEAVDYKVLSARRMGISTGLEVRQKLRFSLARFQKNSTCQAAAFPL